MSRAEPAAPRGAIGRADLLRALAVASFDRLALEHDACAWFGYVRQAERVQRRGEALTVGPTPAQVPERRLPLRLPFLHTIVQREPRQPPDANPQAQPAPAQAAPIDEASAQAPSPVRRVGYEDLVPQARLLPALRRHLGATRAGPLDLDRLMRRLAACELPRHLPRRCLPRWHPELVVLLDFCPRLWPYREDMHRLAERLLRHCGRSGVSLRIVSHGPHGTWSDWLAHQNHALAAEPAQRPWAMPPAGTPVLIVSDLGLLLGPSSAACRAWGGFIDMLRRAQVRPVALAPLGAQQLDAPLAKRVPLLRWSPDAPPRPARPAGVGEPQPAGLADLLAMVAVVRRVDPPLLRALRRLNPLAPLDAGLEGALWCHADVDAGFSVSLRAAAQDAHLRHFRERLAPRLQAELDALRARHHAHLRAVLNHEETLLWAAHADAAVTTAAAAEIEAARDFMRRLLATLDRPDSRRATGEWWAVARDIVRRTDAVMGQREADVLLPLVGALVRAERERAPVPAWADPAALANLLDDGQGPVNVWLVHDAASGSLLLQAQPAGPRQGALGAPLLLDGAGAQVHVGEGASATVHWLTPRALPQALARLDAPTRVQLDTARERVTVAAVRRPPGAQGWGCGPRGLGVRAASLGQADGVWEGDALRATAAPAAAGAAPAWALHADPTEALRVEWPSQRGAGAQVRFGIDGPYGLYADLELATRHGRAVQRLRWIEPGVFRMGSPDDEPGRYDNEGPQHPVTLTRGFWLADSACTQALWRAVLGREPSHFKGDERPVEQVSWHDVQGFLRALEGLLPGCAAGLPTEAEWEYACRAGSATPFSFGAQITPGQVNYDGNHPYAGGAQGPYRAETVAVKSLPANAWGLYEMHGNVWEWCADDLRDYDGQPQTDPQGPAEGEDAQRAVRGGSWVYVARGARSAYRSAFHPGSVDDDQGFRFCLRSIEPGPGRPGGPAGVAPGGRSEAPPPARDESVGARVKRARSGSRRPDRDKGR